MEWISVKDRKPPKNKDVLLVDSLNNIFTGAFVLGKYFEDNYGYDTSDVTHWMPLPEPPKED